MDSAAGIITAVGTLGTLVTAVATLVKVLRTKALTVQTRRIVDTSRADQLHYQAVLIEALQAAGIAIPPERRPPPKHRAT